MSVLCCERHHHDPRFHNTDVNIHRHHHNGLLQPHHEAYLEASAAAAFAAVTMSFISRICSLKDSPNDGGSGGGREGRVTSLMLLRPPAPRLLLMMVLFAATRGAADFMFDALSTMN